MFLRFQTRHLQKSFWAPGIHSLIFPCNISFIFRYMYNITTLTGRERVLPGVPSANDRSLWEAHSSGRCLQWVFPQKRLSGTFQELPCYNREICHFIRNNCHAIAERIVIRFRDWPAATEKIALRFRDSPCCSRETIARLRKGKVAHMFRNCHTTGGRIAILHREVAIHVVVIRASSNCHATS